MNSDSIQCLSENWIKYFQAYNLQARRIPRLSPTGCFRRRTRFQHALTSSSLRLRKQPYLLGGLGSSMLIEIGHVEAIFRLCLAKTSYTRQINDLPKSLIRTVPI